MLFYRFLHGLWKNRPILIIFLTRASRDRFLFLKRNKDYKLCIENKLQIYFEDIENSTNTWYLI